MKSRESIFFIIGLISPHIKVFKNSIGGCQSIKKKFCRGSPLGNGKISKFEKFQKLYQHPKEIYSSLLLFL